MTYFLRPSPTAAVASIEATPFLDRRNYSWRRNRIWFWSNSAIGGEWITEEAIRIIDK